VLGPPKTAFSSSSRFARTNAPAETTTGSEDTEGTRSRGFGDRQQTRNTKTTGEKEGGRDWTALRQPRGPGETDEQKDSNDRLAKYGRRDRERDQDSERRNGDKQDSRWGQREERGQRDDRRQNGERQGGWRDRESNRESNRESGRQNNRGWDRDQAEKEPEWFDEPMKKQEEDLGVGTAHTQADFQKWKEMMKGNKAPAEEVAPTPPPPPPPPAQSTPAKQGASMKLDGFSEPMFGGFGSKSGDAPLESVTNTAKAAPTPSKAKSSRFASVFKKDDVPQTPVAEAPVQQQPMTEPGQGQNEDKAGFQRILQMLGGANIGSPQEPAAAVVPSEPASPQVRGPAGGAKQKSRFFDSVPKSPDVNSPQTRFQSPRLQPGNNLPPVSRNMVDDPNGFFGLPMSQKAPQESSALAFPGIPSNIAPPEPAQPANGSRDSYPPQHHSTEPNVSAPPSRGPPSRGPATPDVGIQNLLAAQRAQRPHASNKDSEFLLGLLQGQAPRPAVQQARPHQDFNLWVGQPPEPHAPKPRAPPPPGLIDDQLLRNAPPEMSRLEHPSMPSQDLGRRSSQRVPTGAPPGFDEHAMFMQQQMQQRRNFAEVPQQPQQQPPPNRRMGGHPSMSGMMPQQQPQFPPDFPFMQSPPIQHQGPPQGGPPPGFAPNMRHPQGFANVPNIFQAQQQQREPPGFAGMMQNPMSPPGPPPGFGAPMPPGLMGMRSPPDGLPAGAGFRGVGRGFENFDGQRR
jgi:hypothetical protein